jgi:hypothetical protein
MADTVITNTPGTRDTNDDASSVLGWVIALIVILAVIVAGFMWVRRGAPVPAATGGGTNINVELPGGTGGTGGGTGGGVTQ